MTRYPQRTACSEFCTSISGSIPVLSRRKTKLVQCSSCRSSQKSTASLDDSADDTCNFRGFRVLVYDATSQKVSYDFRADEAPSGEHQQLRMVFSRKLRPADVEQKKSVARTFLLPVVVDEILAYDVTEAKPIYRPMDPSTRTLCDRCSTGIFSASWFCTQCGKEFCALCFNGPKSAKFCHKTSGFIRVTRFLLPELMSLREKLVDVPEWMPPTVELDDSRSVRRLLRTQLSEERFKAFWGSRRPFVVKDLHKDLQVSWEPEFFIERYGSTDCQVQDCETGKERTCTVAEFFSLFGRAEVPEAILKLKDWPPTANFKAMFPQLHDDFERAMPLPEYITSSGAKNLAAHFPLNPFTPDLGPKMYSALASIFDEKHNGSTRLHLDMSDAVNLLVYAAKARDGSAGYALWHIFAPEDTCHIRAFLNKRSSKYCRGDPIHNQEHFLTQSALDELSSQYKVHPYVIRQYTGQAVFIPAGCAHQVSNQADCMKVACDFISPESVPICKQLWEEFKVQRLARSWPPDVIPFVHMLYWTWESTHTLNISSEQATVATTPRFYCPLCLLPGTHIPTPFDGARRFSYAGGLVDHVVQVHGVKWDKLTQKHCRTLDELPLARRVLREARFG